MMDSRYIYIYIISDNVKGFVKKFLLEGVCREIGARPLFVGLGGDGLELKKRK